MKTVKVKELSVGAVLAKDVKDINGRLLMKIDSVIEDKQIKILKTWGITDVNVVDGTVEKMEGGFNIEDVEPKIIEQVDQEMNVFFRHVNRDHIVMNEIFEYARVKLIKKYQEQR